jgi:hypothetical protein
MGMIGAWAQPADILARKAIIEPSRFFRMSHSRNAPNAGTDSGRLSVTNGRIGASHEAKSLHLANVDSDHSKEPKPEEDAGDPCNIYTSIPIADPARLKL